MDILIKARDMMKSGEIYNSISFMKHHIYDLTCNNEKIYLYYLLAICHNAINEKEAAIGYILLAERISPNGKLQNPKHCILRDKLIKRYL